MILLLSAPDDAHYKYVKGILDKNGVETCTFNTSRFPTENTMSFEISPTEKGSVILKVDGAELNGSEITSVWNRRTPSTVHNVQAPHLREYIDKESQIFFDSLHYLINAFWISHPEALRRGSMKTHQLMVASKLGLLIPDTCIGNSPKEAREFVSHKNNLVLKSLFMPAVETLAEGENDQLLLYTRRLPKQEVAKVAQRVQNCPVILQEYIEKDFELRITIVGNKTFACAIYSQKSKLACEDWRRYDIENTPHEELELPEDINNKLVNFVKSLGLVFGCVDMIVTPKGEFVFLEINPNGQWLWIERITGMPIGEELARMITLGRVEN